MPATAPETIPLLAGCVAGVRFTPLVPDVSPSWTRFNPSVLQLRDGRVVTTVRSSNYSIGPGGRYEILGDGIVRTDTLLLDLDENLGIIRSRPIGIVAPPEPSGTIWGLEDLRLCEVDAGLIAIAASRDRDPDGISRAVLVEFDLDGTVSRERILPGPDRARHEKNWVPFADSTGAVRVVYSWDPLLIGLLDVERAVIHWDGPATTDWGSARGGGGGGRFVSGPHSGWLFVVHEAVVLPDWSRRYLHRFVAVSDEWVPLAASPHFTFLGRGVEFAAGLTIRDERVLVSFGLEDEEAWLASVGLNDILFGMLGLPNDGEQ